MLLVVVGLAFFHHQHGLLALAKAHHLVFDQRVGHVQDVQRHARLAEQVGQVQLHQRAQRVVGHAAQHDHAHVIQAAVAVVEFVEPVRLDELHRRGPALLDFFFLVQKRRGWQHDAVDVAHRVFQRLLEREGRAAVGLRDKAAVQVAGANAQLQHHGGVAGLGQRKAVVHRFDDGGQVGLGVEQPHLRLHGKGVGALLHDGGALAVVLADDDQRAAQHPARGQVGQRVGGHVGAHGGLPGDGPAHRVVDRGRQRGGGGGLAGGGLEVHAQLLQDGLGVGQHVHQVRDRRALVAGDVAHASLQQGLGDGQDALAPKHRARGHLQLLDFLDE